MAKRLPKYRQNVSDGSRSSPSPTISAGPSAESEYTSNERRDRILEKLREVLTQEQYEVIGRQWRQQMQQVHEGTISANTNMNPFFMAFNHGFLTVGQLEAIERVLPTLRPLPAHHTASSTTPVDRSMPPPPRPGGAITAQSTSMNPHLTRTPTASTTFCGPWNENHSIRSSPGTSNIQTSYNQTVSSPPSTTFYGPWVASDMRAHASAIQNPGTSPTSIPGQPTALGSSSSAPSSTTFCGPLQESQMHRSSQSSSVWGAQHRMPFSSLSNQARRPLQRGIQKAQDPRQEYAQSQTVSELSLENTRARLARLNESQAARGGRIQGVTPPQSSSSPFLSGGLSMGRGGNPQQQRQQQISPVQPRPMYSPSWGRHTPTTRPQRVPLSRPRPSISHSQQLMSLFVQQQTSPCFQQPTSSSTQQASSPSPSQQQVSPRSQQQVSPRSRQRLSPRSRQRLAYRSQQQQLLASTSQQPHSTSFVPQRPLTYGAQPMSPFQSRQTSAPSPITSPFFGQQAPIDPTMNSGFQFSVAPRPHGAPHAQGTQPVSRFKAPHVPISPYLAAGHNTPRDLGTTTSEHQLAQKIMSKQAVVRLSDSQPNALNRPPGVALFSSAVPKPSHARKSILLAESSKLKRSNASRGPTPQTASTSTRGGNPSVTEQHPAPRRSSLAGPSQIPRAQTGYKAPSSTPAMNIFSPPARAPAPLQTQDPAATADAMHRFALARGVRLRDLELPNYTVVSEYWAIHCADLWRARRCLLGPEQEV